MSDSGRRISAGAVLPLGCFSFRMSRVVFDTSSPSLPVGMRSFSDKTPPFALLERRRRAALTLPCSMRRLKIRDFFSKFSARLVDGARCFWIHLPSWRRVLISPFCHSFSLRSKWAECSLVLLLACFFCNNSHCMMEHDVRAMHSRMEASTYMYAW